MTEEGVIHVGAWILIILPILNLFFVRDGYLKFKKDPEHSRILFALWVVKLTMWIFGLVFALFAVRYLMGFPPLPFNGLTLVVMVIVVELLPAFIYSILSTYNNGHD